MVVAMTCLVGCAVFGLIVFAMLGRREVWDIDAGVGRLARLRKRKARVLRAVKDLEAERDSGALTNDEFRKSRAAFVQEAAALSKQLDQVRRFRARNVARGGGAVSTALRKRVETAIAERRDQAAGALLAVPALFVVIATVCGTSAVQAGVTFAGKIYDAEASFPALRAALQRDQHSIEAAFADELKTPYVGKLQVDLLSTSGTTRGERLGSWATTTAADGAFSVDTGRDSIPSGAAFVASADIGGAKVFSPFMPLSSAASVMLYRTTESTDGLRPDIKVTYDYTESTPKKLRIQVRATFLMRDYEMYVGASQLGASREIGRVRIPAGAQIVENIGPDESSPGWVMTGDGRALVLDAPVAGLYDNFRANGLTWTVTYDVPAVQRLTQSFRWAFPIKEPQGLQFWCVHKDMAIASQRLAPAPPMQNPDAPVHKKRAFERFYPPSPIEAGAPLVLHLTVDNAPIGQMRRESLRWVGGFLVAFLVSITAGVLLGGRRRAAPEALYGDLSGEELLDLIAELDRKHEAGGIRKADYEPQRELLVRLVAEEYAAEDSAASTESTPTAQVAAAVLPPGVDELLSKLDELESSDAAGDEVDAERVRLLDELAKLLPRRSARA